MPEPVQSDVMLRAASALNRDWTALARSRAGLTRGNASSVGSKVSARRATARSSDEPHLYCPERGMGEAESIEAVVSLISQGRKHGYAGIITMQHLSKLHKDAAAEANNVIVGRTELDADQARA